MQTRTVALIGLIGLAGGWLAGSMSAPPEPQASATERRGPRPLGSSGPAAPFTEQLRLKLQEQPRSPSPGRNPFTFGSRRLSSPAAARAREAEVETTAVALMAIPVEAPRPRFELSGIAASQIDGAAVWTAILTDSGSLVFAKAGDTLGGGYTVAKVDETSVVIVDASGVEQRLRLK